MIEIFFFYVLFGIVKIDKTKNKNKNLRVNKQNQPTKKPGGSCVENCRFFFFKEKLDN